MKWPEKDSFRANFRSSLIRFYYKFFSMLGTFFQQIPPFRRWLEQRSGSNWAMWLQSLLCSDGPSSLLKRDLSWWSFKSMDIINQQPHSSRVFEWGSGASTIWLAKRFSSVTSVEHDYQWYVKVRSEVIVQSLDHVNLIFIPGEESDNIEVPSQKSGFAHLDFREYVNSISSFDYFDLIIIDGRARANCIEEATQHVSPGGIIFLDNGSRRRYKRAICMASEKGFAINWIKGLTPGSIFPTRSCILTMETNCRRP